MVPEGTIQAATAAVQGLTDGNAALAGGAALAVAQRNNALAGAAGAATGEVVGISVYGNTIYSVS
nr:hypothetical protein [Escherichia coli]